MKQYLDQQQTAKLIDLGFEKPKGWYVDGVTNNINLYVNIDKNPMMFNYSIGELLSFLPLTIQWTPRVIKGNVIEYSFETEGSELYYCNARNELIDNLFDMCVKLKEEGVI